MSEAAPIGIIATSGRVPLDLARALRGQGRDVVVVMLEGVTTADFDGFTTFQHHIGAIGHIINDLKDSKCQQVIFAGYLNRPPLKSIKPDWRGMKIFTKVMTSGDNEALKEVKAEFAKSDLEVMSVNQFMPELYAEAGIIAGHAISEEAMAAVSLGCELLQATSPFDTGQGAVVQGKRVLALEGAEGTNGLLNRSAALIDQDAGEAVFVKMMKVGQDPNLDPPGIGEETITHAAEANIGVIAVEVGSVIIIDKPSVVAAAARHQITIIGVDAGDLLVNE